MKQVSWRDVSIAGVGQLLKRFITSDGTLWIKVIEREL